MPNNPVTGLPGVQSDRTASFRRVTLADAKPLPGGLVVRGADSRDPLNTGDLDVLRAGMVLGKNTSTGKYAPTIIGTLASAFDTDASDPTTMTVSAAPATELDRRIGSSGSFKLVGPPTAGGTVAVQTVTYSAVNTSTGAITVTDPGADAISGSFICDTDGTEDPLIVVGDGYGAKVTDIDDTSTDIELPGQAGMQPLIGGVLDSSQIVNWPSDSALQTWLKGKLNGGDGTAEGHGAFVFDDRFVN